MSLGKRMWEEYEEIPAKLDLLDMTVTEIDHITALKYGIETVAGLFVLAVRRGSAAHLAGVVIGDIITEVNLKPVITLKDLEYSLAAHEPRTPIRLMFRRVGIWRILSLPVD